jgi:hypothetical protein
MKSRGPRSTSPKLPCEPSEWALASERTSGCEPALCPGHSRVTFVIGRDICIWLTHMGDTDMPRVAIDVANGPYP